MTPKPSQPRSKLTRLGLKTNKNIDAIKLKTNPINRPKNTSFIIYEVLKIITLPDTRLTNLMKYKDIKSKIKTTLIIVDPIDNNSHSNNISSMLIKKKER